MVEVPLPGHQSHVRVRGEISWEDFLKWFYVWTNRKVQNGEVPRV